MMKARKYVVLKHFMGLPKRSDFKIVEHVLPKLQDGEVLVKSEYISVDPALQAYNSEMEVPCDQNGFNIGVIQETKNPDYVVGDKIVSHNGWADYFIGDPSQTIYKLPDLKGLPSSLGVGAVGLPGAIAYFGLLEVCQPKAEETVVVTGAAGAVGSLVGQIAKIKGCKVLGFAGSDEKVEWLEKELGYDKAFNYKKVATHEALKEAAPDGIDCFFDNVGGELSSTIIGQMNMFGRVAVCGSISSYHENPETMPKATILQPSIVKNKLKIEGLYVWKWADRRNEAFADIIGWIHSGKLKAKEHVTEGFDNVYDAFIGMLKGENFGKAVVKV